MTREESQKKVAQYESFYAGTQFTSGFAAPTPAVAQSGPVVTPSQPQPSQPIPEPPAMQTGVYPSGTQQTGTYVTQEGTFKVEEQPYGQTVIRIGSTGTIQPSPTIRLEPGVVESFPENTDLELTARGIRDVASTVETQPGEQLVIKKEAEKYVLTTEPTLAGLEAPPSMMVGGTSETKTVPEKVEQTESLFDKLREAESPFHVDKGADQAVSINPAIPLSQKVITPEHYLEIKDLVKNEEFKDYAMPEASYVAMTAKMQEEKAASKVLAGTDLVNLGSTSKTPLDAIASRFSIFEKPTILGGEEAKPSHYSLGELTLGGPRVEPTKIYEVNVDVSKAINQIGERASKLPILSPGTLASQVEDRAFQLPSFIPVKLSTARKLEGGEIKPSGYSLGELVNGGPQIKPSIAFDVKFDVEKMKYKATNLAVWGTTRAPITPTFLDIAATSIAPGLYEKTPEDVIFEKMINIRRNPPYAVKELEGGQTKPSQYSFNELVSGGPKVNPTKLIEVNQFFWEDITTGPAQQAEMISIGGLTLGSLSVAGSGVGASIVQSTPAKLGFLGLGVVYTGTTALEVGQKLAAGKKLEATTQMMQYGLNLGVGTLSFEAGKQMELERNPPVIYTKSAGRALATSPENIKEGEVGKIIMEKEMRTSLDDQLKIRNIKVRAAEEFQVKDLSIEGFDRKVGIPRGGDVVLTYEQKNSWWGRLTGGEEYKSVKIKVQDIGFDIGSPIVSEPSGGETFSTWDFLGTGKADKTFYAERGTTTEIARMVNPKGTIYTSIAGEPTKVSRMTLFKYGGGSLSETGTSMDIGAGIYYETPRIEDAFLSIGGVSQKMKTGSVDFGKVTEAMSKSIDSIISGRLSSELASTNVYSPQLGGIFGITRPSVVSSTSLTTNQPIISQSVVQPSTRKAFSFTGAMASLSTKPLDIVYQQPSSIQLSSPMQEIKVFPTKAVIPTTQNIFKTVEMPLSTQIGKSLLGEERKSKLLSTPIAGTEMRKESIYPGSRGSVIDVFLGSKEKEKVSLIFSSQVPIQEQLQRQQVVQKSRQTTPTTQKTAVPFTPVLVGLKPPAVPILPFGFREFDIGLPRRDYKRKNIYRPSIVGLMSGKTIAKAPRHITGVEIRYPVRARGLTMKSLGIGKQRKKGRRK